MSYIVFILEEESAMNMLKPIVRQLVPAGIYVKYITCNGKQDLERQLVRKIRSWQYPESRFIILRDQDSGDCQLIKQQLLELVRQTGKAEVCLVRIACHELESFFLGDLAAVAQGLACPDVATRQRKRNFRTPDRHVNASEMLKKLTNGKYTKLRGSRAISPYLKLDGSNRSHSFGALLNAIRRQVDEIRQADV